MFHGQTKSKFLVDLTVVLPIGEPHVIGILGSFGGIVFDATITAATEMRRRQSGIGNLSKGLLTDTDAMRMCINQKVGSW